MPWAAGVFTRTNGTYNGATVWGSDAAANVKIMSNRHDTHDQDLATGINACVAKDGSNTVTSLNLTGTVNAMTGVITIGGVNFANTMGTGNVFVGNSGNFTLTGFNNSAVGNGAFVNATIASHCCAFGAASLAANTNGIDNCAFGDSSLPLATSGSANTAVGYNSLATVTTGSFNIGIGNLADVPSATANGQLSIQNAIYGTSNTGTASTVSTGNIGLYTKAPTARLHLPAGTATAGTAPLKLTAGTLLGSVEDGALEYDGTHLYFTHGATRTQIV